MKLRLRMRLAYWRTMRWLYEREVTRTGGSWPQLAHLHALDLLVLALEREIRRK